MKSIGYFKFKEIVKRDGGSFTNERGEKIEYKPSYLLKVDERTDRGIFERIFRIPVDSSLLAPLLKLEPYCDITMEFDVNIYGSRISLVPISVNQ